MNEIEQHYNKFNEEKRLDSRHGKVEYITSMKYIHKYIFIYINIYLIIVISQRFVFLI